MATATLPGNSSAATNSAAAAIGVREAHKGIGICAPQGSERCRIPDASQPGRAPVYWAPRRAANPSTDGALMTRLLRCLLIAAALASMPGYARSPLVLMTDFGTQDG